MSTSPYTTHLHGRGIRLLRLSPGNPDAPISVMLSYASLDNPPPYEALSYVLGDATITEPIACDGIIMNVTINLAKALRRVRQRLALTEPRFDSSATSTSREAVADPESSNGKPCAFLWIDALCINQQDISERNRQVSMMGDVYATAIRVLVWLGDVDIETRHEMAAARALRRVAWHCVRQLTSRQQRASDRQGSIFEDNVESLSPTELTKQMRELGFPEVWKSLRLLYSSQWFDRIWCVQGYMKAQDVTVLLRSTEFTGFCLRVFAVWLESPKRELLDTADTEDSGGYSNYDFYHTTVRATSGAMIFQKIPQDWHPCDVLNSCSTLEATDPRDKIYGIQGIVQPGFFEPDYHKSVRDVFTHATTRMLQRDLRVLCEIYHPSDYEAPDDYPSWVCPWDDTVSSANAYWPGARSQGLIFAGPRKGLKVDQELARDGILRLTGVSCGVVVEKTCFELQKMDGLSPEMYVKAQIDNRQAFLKLWRRHTYECDSWDSLPIVELAMTLTGGYFNNLTNHIAGLGSQVEQAFMFNFLTCARNFLSVNEGMPDGLKTPPGDGHLYDFEARNALHHSWVFHTSRNWLCLGPRCARTGDLLVVFNEGPTPYILRPASDGPGKFILMGACFVYRLAKGQINDLIGQDGFEERTFDLI